MARTTRIVQKCFLAFCGCFSSLIYDITESEMPLQKGVELFLKWAIMQGVAMILQNRYQRQRLYTRIALGKVIIFGLIVLFVTVLLCCLILDLPLFLFS